MFSFSCRPLRVKVDLAINPEEPHGSRDSTTLRVRVTLCRTFENLETGGQPVAEPRISRVRRRPGPVHLGSLARAVVCLETHQTSSVQIFKQARRGFLLVWQNAEVLGAKLFSRLLNQAKRAAAGIWQTKER